MATDHAWHPEPIDLAPEVVLLPGFDGSGADPFLVPVNALLLGASARLLVVPGVGRAPWTPALTRLAEQVRWIVSARPAPTPDLHAALARCRHAVSLDAVNAGEALAAGRFTLVDPPTVPVRSRAVHDAGRRVLYSADGFGAPVLLPATDADDLDDAYWQQAAATHARWSGSDGARAAALAALGTELIVPAFGPVLHGRRRAAALRATAPSSPPCATDAAYRARMEELLAIGC